MATLTELIEEYGASGFVYCDRGSGSAYGENGEYICFDEEASDQYCNVEMHPERLVSADGVECNYASDWIGATNGYQYKIRF